MILYLAALICWWKGHDWRQYLPANAYEVKWEKRHCWRCGYFEYRKRFVPGCHQREPWDGETLEQAVSSVEAHEANMDGLEFYVRCR